MRWPLLSGKSQLTKTTDVFGGYNHNLRISEGEFYEMRNMTSREYPILASRKARGIYQQAQAPGGMIAKDGLCYVDGEDFVINGYRVEMGLSTREEDCPKQLLSMGAYVIILPDKKYINTADLSDRGNMEAAVTTAEPVVFTLCDGEGTDHAVSYIQPGEPEKPGHMELWVDTSAVPNVLKQWSETSGMWIAVSTTYVKIASPGIGKPFSQYDGVCIRGLSGVLTDSESEEALANTRELAALEGTAVIQAKGDDHIVITGMLSVTRSICEPVTVSREMPLMDFVIERENRLWGCRYGLDRNGAVVNEIYASKLGDFKNWNCFMGISTDSYAVSVGSDGPFTGAVCYAGYPLFWKENCVHKLFGDYPANFGITTTACRGVQAGCAESLAIVGELLYYKARHAVCVYDGSLPVEISTALGNVSCERAAAGGHGNKYYISMKETGGTGVLYVYDTARNLWHREDELDGVSFCSCREELYCIEKDTNRILALLGSGESWEGKVPWMVQTGILGADLSREKYISRLTMRLSMKPGASMRVLIQYDSAGQWEQIGNVTAVELRSFAFPVRPRRCDHFRLRLEGEGSVKIHSWTKYLRQGSERICR